VEGHGDVLEGIDLLGVVVVLQIHEQSLLVGEIPVAGQVVMDLQVTGTIL
jgi:hypothetical protein